MAAAALCRSRGVAGARATKGLFFVVTLMLLVCLASSWLEKDEMDRLKENIRKAEQQVEKLKADYKSEMDSISENIDEFQRSMDTQAELMKKISGGLPDGFPSSEGVLQSTKRFMEELKTFTEVKRQELGEEIEKAEQEMRKYQQSSKLLEELHAEL